MRTLIVIMALLCAGCAAKPADKPVTIEEWMQVPRDQRLADPDYCRLLLERLNDDLSLLRAIEIIHQRRQYEEKLKGAANDDRAEVQDREQ